MTKNKHVHYQNEVEEECNCVACQIDRGIDKKIYIKSSSQLRCEKQQNELDKFIEENQPLTWWQTISNTISYYFSKKKETIEVT